MLYLAAPYTHENPKITEEWVKLTANAAAWLMAQGHHVIAPTLFGHTLVQTTGFEDTHTFWVDWGLNLLSRCDELYVLKLDGWKESKGIKQEVQEARKNGMQITFLRFDGEEWQIDFHDKGKNKDIVRERKADYGPIEETAERFREMAGSSDPLAYYRTMIFAKLARMEGKGNRQHEDSWKDIYNYAHAAWKECLK